VLNDENIRILDKIDSGVSYFVSQCIFNVQYTKRVLDDLLVSCEHSKQELPTMIFTLTVCGSLKTLNFMEWLGIHVPEDIKEELSATSNPVGRSVEIAVGIATELIRYCTEKLIPFGFNIESVAIRKEEIDASLYLINTISEMLKAKGLRNAAQATAPHLILNSNV
jgi:5,10-methylenetetrahydrofolate reductase